LRRVADDDEVALRVEKGHPELRGRLISTIQLARMPNAAASHELIAALEEDTLSFTGGLSFTDIIDVQLLKRIALAAGGLLLLSIALGAWRSDFAKAMLARLALSERQYPTAARFVTVTPSGVVAKGDPQTITVTLDPDGVLPDSASAALRSAGGQTTQLVLVRVKGATGKDAGKDGKPVEYKGILEHVLEDVEFRPAAHDALWPRWEKLTVLQRPAVKTLALVSHFPAYLGRADETSSIGDLRVPAGDLVRLTATLTKKVKSARIVTRDNQQAHAPLEMTLDEARTTATFGLTVNEAGYYKILLRCVDDLDNSSPVEYAIDAVKDRAPTVRISFPAQDKTVTRFAHWPVRFSGRDDYGIARAALKYRVMSAPAEGAAPAEADTAPDAADAPPAQSLALEGLITAKNQKEASGEVNFDLRPLNLQPGQRVIYWIDYEDNREPGANHGKSQTYTFNVVDVAVLQEMLDRDRNAVLEGIQTIRDKEKDTRDGVDKIRRDLPTNASPNAPTPGK
ncbi:MAG: hypothetical protein H0X38_16275, partial [Planctomycetes bacterium]|nr:hypothetical protein [Planctomycetota bacterium]